MSRVPYLALLFAFTLASHAQAPIERRPPTASPEWDTFTATSADYLGSNVTITSSGRATRCMLDQVTPDGLFCHFDFGPALFLPIPRPAPGLQFPRQSITTIRHADKPASTLLGIGVGFGIGAGLGAAGNSSYKTQSALIGGALLGIAGGFIGHAFPLIRHTLYRTPQHS